MFLDLKNLKDVQIQTETVFKTEKMIVLKRQVQLKIMDVPILTEMEFSIKMTNVQMLLVI